MGEKNTIDWQNEFRKQIERNDEERRRIRQQLYDIGYPMMSLEQAERTARKLTVKQ